MNRELKFRAWDNVDKRMIVHEQDFIPLKVTNLGVLRLSPNHEESFWEWMPQDRFLLTEYTELKDKKGTEIYEKDVVKFHYFHAGLGENMGVEEREHELIGVVEWGSFGWGLSAISGEHWKGYTGYSNGEGSSNFLDLMAMNEGSIHEESFEKLGNIFEHPELIKP